jgi:hypothetical protein
MRAFAMPVLMAMLPFFVAPVWIVRTSALAHFQQEPKVVEGRRLPTSIERHLEEVRASHAQSDYYSVLRLEIEALRRDAPEHSDFLDRYLQSQLMLAK